MQATVTNHTPGPWRISGGRHIEGADLLPVAMVLDSTNQERTQADARLIAAAPEMLVTLERIARFVKPWVRADNQAGDIYEMATRAILLARVEFP